MKDSSAPQSPDPRVTIPLQTQANLDVFNTMLNASRANTVTPFGSMSWSKTPTFDQAGYDAALDAWNKQGGAGGTTREWVPNAAGGLLNPESQDPSTGGSWMDVGKTGGGSMPSKEDFTTYNWTNTTTLSPEQQALYDKNVQSQLSQADLLKSLTERVAESTSKPLDLSSLPGLYSDQGLSENYMRGLADRSTGENFSRSVADATYGQASRYLDPQFQRDQGSLESRLAEQGFVPGTPGYDRAMSTFQDTRNRAYGQAKDAAITAGYGQANTQLGLQNQIAGLLGNYQNMRFGQSSNARNQALNEILTQRNHPLNELSAIRSGTQVQMPTGQTTYQTPNLPTTDVMGAYNQHYQNQLGQYNANVGSNNALFGDILGLAGTAMLPGAGGLFSGLGKLFG